MTAETSDLGHVFLSDLHLGSVPPTASAPYVAGFASLLDHLQARASAERHACRLVLLGDTLDFMKVPASPGNTSPSRQISEASALSKLEQLARQEPLFFTALGRFAAGGLSVEIVAGNHDIDLVRPAAQQRFRELVERASGCSGAGHQIRFHPWIYHVPGVVYAEHGQQHHDVNSFATVLQPYLPGGGDRLDLPLAAHLPTSGRPSSVAWVPATARAGMSVLHQAMELGSPRRAGRRIKYRDEVLGPYAEEIGLDHAAVVAIDRLSEVSVASIATRLMRKALAGRGQTGRPTQQGGYLHGAASAIHRILASAGVDVPYYVFGHTHIAERFPLAPGAPSPEYLNTGTWSPHLPKGAARPDKSPLLTFVQIRGVHGSRPAGEVLVWDDEGERVRPACRRPE